MTVRAFSGGAGCGKTYRLMQALSDHLEQTPLNAGQKVLALTFMHGSRRRLHERLSSIPALAYKHECATVDSFAWRIVRRWQALLLQLGLGIPAVGNYDQVCDAAATALQQDIVVRWVAATFPIVLLDEAQDLTPVRLRIVRALATRLEVVAAADEFQCLDEQLRPNPACTWLAEVGNIENLAVPKRTTVPALLQAASAIRSGVAPVSNGLFRIDLTPKPQLAGSWVANALGWYGGNKRVAVITPATGQFSEKVIEWVGANTTKQGHGPFNIRWERSESQAAADFLAQLHLPDIGTLTEIDAAVRLCGDLHVTHDVAKWLNLQRRTRGRSDFAREEIEAIVQESFSNRRRRQRDTDGRFRAMTVHGAKNREFDNVIVLWPAAVGGSDDQKRRLLYNAVTRARSRCLVLVQAKAALTQAPFV